MIERLHNPLHGETIIPDQPVDPRYLDSYDWLDRRVGLALFDANYRRQSQINLAKLLAEPER